MNQELMMKDNLETYNCQICREKAHKPVITRCGHLYCWACFYKQDPSPQVFCKVCDSRNEKNDIYPLFIEQDITEQEDTNLPERPLPVNRPKIPNADIMGARSNFNKNNIAMGRQLAGTVFLAPLSVTAFSQIDDPQEGDIQKSTSIRLKCIFIIVFTLLIIFFGVYLLL